MAIMADRDSSPDAEAPEEDAWSEDDAPKSATPPKTEEPPAKSERPPAASERPPAKSERPPAKSVRPAAPKERPPFPERINTIDIMPGTLIGAHLPPLLEEEAKKRAAAAAALAEAAPREAPAEKKVGSAAREVPSDDNESAWRSPLDTRPAWLIKLMSVPPRLLAIGGGCLIFSLVVVSAARGCSGHSRIDALEARVANLEKATGVVTDGGAMAIGESSDSPGASSGAATGTKLAPAAASADDPKKAKCALAKVTAYQAWQEAVDKAKANAAPAEAKCADFWTESKKQACYGAAMQGVHPAQVARDSVMKGGATARDAVKKVKDDPKNDAVARARAASEAAFDTCQDENEL